MIEQKLFSKDLHQSIPKNRDVFGKFVGQWELLLTITDSFDTSSQYKGEWHFDRILQGRAIQDIWMIPGLANNESDEFHEYGTTIRTFNPKTNRWKAVWVGPIQNQFFVFDITDSDEAIILTETKNPKLEMKWSFYDISENSFQWKSEIKIKGSDRWLTNYHMELMRI
ncbi:MAG: hypothetical protein AAF039_12430 [Bacteroidota bacterium]